VLAIGGFELTYQFDEIPHATVQPALGTGLVKDTTSSLADIREGESCRLLIKVNNQTRTLFSGYVSAINSDDNSTITERRFTASLELTHISGKLAGSPPMQFSTTNRVKNVIMAASDKPAFVQALIQSDLVIDKNGTSSVYAAFSKIFSGTIFGHFPAILIREAAVGLNNQFSSIVKADTIVRAFEQANTQSLLLDVLTTTNNIITSFTEAWPTSNTWEAMKRTANYFFLHIIPFNSGVIVANPIGHLKTPNKTITAREYFSIKQSASTNFLEPVDGIVVRIPTQNDIDKPFVYPPNLLDPKNIPENAYLHHASLPAWLNPVLKTTFGTRKAQRPTRAQAGSNTLVASETPLDEFYRLVGERAAKMIYSQFRGRKAGVSLAMPFRTDLMPGTVVKIENTDEDTISFLGETLFGMISNTLISGSMLENSGRLNTVIQVVNVRNDADNKQLGFDDHPIYGVPWVGINLFGTYLAEPEEVDFPKSKSSSAVNQNAERVPATR
jgi:hypothetical protein